MLPFGNNTTAFMAHIQAIGEAGDVAVLPWCCAPLDPGWIPSPGARSAFGFQSILASTGFSLGFSCFPPASKTELLD